MQIKGARNFGRAELGEMRREPLNVEQGETAFSQTFDQLPKRNLGRIGGAVKHRFAEERAADGHAVETSGKLARQPRLHGMRPSEFVQLRIALNDFVIDPRVFTLRAFANRGAVIRRSRYSANASWAFGVKT